MSEEQKYEEFIAKLTEAYPRAMRNVYCGISINEGWYKIVLTLVKEMKSHIDAKRRRRANDLRLIRAMKKGEAAVAKFLSRGKEPSVWELERAAEIMEDKEPRQPSEVVHHIEIHQVKEKFGGLRFYFQGGDDYCYGMLSMAEAWASVTCEVCGAPGQERPGGWVKTLCDEHAKRK